MRNIILQSLLTLTLKNPLSDNLYWLQTQ